MKIVRLGHVSALDYTVHRQMEQMISVNVAYVRMLNPLKLFMSQ